MIEVRWARPLLTAERRDLALAGLSSRERKRELSEGFLAGRLVLKRLVTELTGDPSPAIEQVCADCGGPHGRPTYEGLWLSLSRCADAVLAAASTLPIGIDVEPRGAASAHWTRTEAVLKADGRGLRVDPDDVDFNESAARIGGRGIRYLTADLELDPSLQVSLAVAEDASGTAISRRGRRAALARTLTQVRGSRSW